MHTYMHGVTVGHHDHFRGPSTPCEQELEGDKQTIPSKVNLLLEKEFIQIYKK